MNCTLPFQSTSTDKSWLLKRASAIAYDAPSAQVVVADKTGDVYSFSWPVPPVSLEKYQKIPSLPPVDVKTPLTKSTDERFMGTFLLSHSSSVVDCTFATAPWGRVLVTVDRDEHVRISCFPQTWVIAAMGLGHTAFVTCVAEVEGGIVSGGGDRMVIKWDYAGGKRAEHDILQGTCVRLVRPWKDLVVVVGEEEKHAAAPGDTEPRGFSVVEVLRVEDLSTFDTVKIQGAGLDVAFHEDVMFVSCAGEHVPLIREYRWTATGIEQVETDRWNSSDSLETGPKVELFWLESMRKQIGQMDDD